MLPVLLASVQAAGARQLRLFSVHAVLLRGAVHRVGSGGSGKVEVSLSWWDGIFIFCFSV